MHIIVVGAGAVGAYLVQLALDGGHDVVLIEADEERARHCSEIYDARVLNAAIGEADILDEAGAGVADALVATTEDDSINLMAMVLGQQYEIGNLISAVNSSHRKSLFERLGVSMLVDPEILAARHLLNLVLHPGDAHVTSLAGKGQIYELQLADGSDVAGRSLGELDEGDTLPNGCCVVMIERDGKHLLPRDSVRLRAGDDLLVYSVDPLTRKNLSLFTGERE